MSIPLRQFADALMIAVSNAHLVKDLIDRMGAFRTAKFSDFGTIV